MTAVRPARRSSARAPRPPAETQAFFDRAPQRRQHLLAARVAPRASARHTGALVMLASLEASRGRYDEVERLCRCALALAPGLRPARRHLALALLEMGRHEEAERILDAMVAADYSDAEAHWYRALSQLARGALAGGWAEFDWRWRLPHTMEPFVPPVPEWRNSPVRGRRLWLQAEPRLYDELVFLSMLPDLLARQAEVTVECDPRLVTLLGRSFPAARLTHDANEAATESCDYQIELGSLAGYLRSDITAFPKRGGYLVADPLQQMCWRAWLNGLGDGLKVGLVCRGDDAGATAKTHFARARHWLPLLGLPDVQFVCLHDDVHARQLDDAAAQAGLDLHHPPGLDRNRDLDGLAALISTLDLVVAPPAVATALAGGLGVPAWQLNCGIDWHGLNQPYFAWQPSVRRFYKPWDRSWDDELAGVAIELERLAERSRQKRQKAIAASTPTR